MAEKKLVPNKPVNAAGATYFSPAADTLVDDKGEPVPLQDALEAQRELMQKAAEDDKKVAEGKANSPEVERELNHAASQIASKENISLEEARKKLDERREADAKFLGQKPETLVKPGDEKTGDVEAPLSPHKGTPQPKNDDPKSAPSEDARKADQKQSAEDAQKKK